MELLPIILVIGGLWFLMIRPQQKRERSRRELVKSLEPGDEVVTNAGIHGAVVELEETVVWLEVAPEVELKISRDAVVGKVGSSAAEDADDADDADE